MAHVFQTKHIFPFPKHKGNLINWRFEPFPSDHHCCNLEFHQEGLQDLFYWKLSCLLLFIFPKNLQPPTILKRMDRQVSVPWSGTSRMEAWRKPDFISSHELMVWDEQMIKRMSSTCPGWKGSILNGNESSSNHQISEDMLVSGTVHAFNGFPNLLWRMLWFFPQLNALVSLKNKNK